ncbi:hypothetical protein [Occallatibacter savannae]|uniref:hypothetical protein n=1 Tax=Occallatibacter savannae TaxID=1002691 RepID=UPI000D69BAA3|nr:hypothetical protein [Occallatibacter savannae]
MTALKDWESFYVIVGSSAGALIGIQFVVVTLIAGMPNVQRQTETSNAFVAPTIVHFVIALAISGLLSAPWPGLMPLALLLVGTGSAGLFYELIVVRRMSKQSDYRPQLEDWIFHALIPLLSYGALVVSACMISVHTPGSLFGVAGAVLGLLFAGIHNAWDTVCYLVFTKKETHHDA